MPKRVLVNGDSVFLNVKALPRLLEQLGDSEVFVFENPGFSYWFEKLAKVSQTQLTVIPEKITTKSNETRNNLIKKLIRENGISEQWFVTKTPMDALSFVPSLVEDCILRVFDADTLRPINVDYVYE